MKAIKYLIIIGLTMSLFSCTNNNKLTYDLIDNISSNTWQKVSCLEQLNNNLYKDLLKEDSLKSIIIHELSKAQKQRIYKVRRRFLSNELFGNDTTKSIKVLITDNMEETINLEDLPIPYLEDKNKWQKTTTFFNSEKPIEALLIKKEITEYFDSITAIINDSTNSYLYFKSLDDFYNLETNQVESWEYRVFTNKSLVNCLFALDELILDICLIENQALNHLIKVQNRRMINNSNLN